MKRILMDFSLSGIKTALMYDRELIEIIVDDYENRSLVGNIYIGKVERVVPNQFAFIDIGEERNCFLPLEGVKEQNGLKIKQGDQLIVQISKDKQEEKGAFVTAEICLTGSFCVLVKSDRNIAAVGISQKIKDEEKRTILKEQIRSILPDGYGAIVRTEGENASVCEISEEIRTLHEKLSEIIEKSMYIKAPFLIYSEGNIVSALKTFLGSDKDTDEIIINDPEKKSEIEKIVKSFCKDKIPEISLYDEEPDMLSHYGAESQISKALNEKVWLKSGGFLLIEETKTCTVIDVNTGKFVNKKSRKKVILQNNFEAAKEIAKQLRLRNLSGMILVDFVDLSAEEDKKSLIEYFEKELKKDRIVANIVDYSALNIVQLTRKKTRMPLSFMLTDKCPLCTGTGQVPKISYIGDSIYKKVKQLAAQSFFNKITVSSNSRIINYLEKMKMFEELKKMYNTEIKFVIINTGKLDYYEIEKERK